MHPQISVNIRSLCGESECILSLQVAAWQQHIAVSGKTFRGHVYEVELQTWVCFASMHRGQQGLTHGLSHLHEGNSEFLMHHVLQQASPVYGVLEPHG